MFGAISAVLRAQGHHHRGHVCVESAHQQQQIYPYSFFKKIINKPLAGLPPSLRLKEPQTKLTSLIPTERLQEISWQDFWPSHAPRGASVILEWLRLLFVKFGTIKIRIILYRTIPYYTEFIILYRLKILLRISVSGIFWCL